MLMSERNFISTNIEEEQVDEDEEKEEKIEEDVGFDEIDDWENLLEDDNDE